MSDDVAAWLREEIARCERRLERMRTLLAILEQQELSPTLGERVEEVKMGRKRVARVMSGEDYVRLVFSEPIKLPQEIREYLGTIEEELRALQARTGEQQLVKLSMKEVDGAAVEVRYGPLYTTVEMLKARAALKYTAEAILQMLKGGGHVVP